MTVCGSQDGKIQLLTITKDVALVEFWCTLYLLACQVTQVFLLRLCDLFRVYVPWICSHVRWELPGHRRLRPFFKYFFFIVVFEWRLSSAHWLISWFCRFWLLTRNREKRSHVPCRPRHGIDEAMPPVAESSTVRHVSLLGSAGGGFWPLSMIKVSCDT